MCGAMGKAYKNMFNFNAGVLVIRPSTEMLDDMLQSALVVGSNSKQGEAGFLNKYFLHWCTHGKLIQQLSGDQLIPHPQPFRPTFFNPHTKNGRQADGEVVKTADITEGRCHALREKYNWRWGLKIAETFIGFYTAEQVYDEGIKVVHYAGNVKPWEWKMYPLHGWISFWHQYASQIPDLYDDVDYSFYLYVPFVILVAVYVLSYATLLHKILAKLLYKLTFWNIWPLNTLVWKFTGMLVLGDLSMVVIPIVLFQFDLVLPPVLSPWIGWLLYLEWCVFIYWIVFGSYCYYNYLMGIEVALKGPEAFKQQQHWLEYSKVSLLPSSASLFLTCSLHSMVFAMILLLCFLNFLVLLAWSCAAYRLLVLEFYGGLLLVSFIPFAGGLPRLSFLRGYKSHQASPHSIKNEKQS